MSCTRARKLSALIVASILMKKRKAARKKREMWVREWIMRRSDLGVHNTLLQELKAGDPAQLDNFLRMKTDDFQYLLSLISPLITKKDTNMRRAITASERLCVTLRFLATGDSYHSLMYLFRIPVCTISKIIPECCQAIYQSLKDLYMQVPMESQEWLNKAESFEKLWNFPHCIGALDGKHITIQAPAKEGSYWYNYKGFHSLVLMALVDANYKFLYIDVGCNGRVSDGGVFNNCSLEKALSENSLGVPPPQALLGREQLTPYVVVADDAFALKPYIMKPFPNKGQGATNRIFNYRLSRARRVVENAFGIIANRFRVLRKPIELCPEKTAKVVLAICTLHNFLLSSKNGSYASQTMVDCDDRPGDWRVMGMPESNLLSVEPGNAHNFSLTAKAVREEFKEYFVTPEGEVPWQYKHI